MSLRSKLIRLAHANPELRSDLLPLVVGTAKAASDDYIQVGDLVEAKASRGPVEVTVVAVRPMRTGKTEVQLTTKDGKDFTFKADGSTYTQNSRVLKLIRRQGAAAAQEVSQERFEREMGRSEAKEDFAEMGRKALETFDPMPGDKVTIEYRGGPMRVEIVNGVNWKTGKVGVVKETRMSPAERQQLEVSFWLMNQMSGRNIRPPLERDTRWIPAHQIVRIEKLKKPAGV